MWNPIPEPWAAVRVDLDEREPVSVVALGGTEDDPVVLVASTEGRLSRLRSQDVRLDLGLYHEPSRDEPAELEREPRQELTGTATG